MAQRTRAVLTGYAFVLPAAVIILGLVGYPIVQAMVLSLTNARVGEAGHFVGLANYAALLRNSVFLQALGNSVLFTVVSVTVKTVLGLAVALLLNQKFLAHRWIRGAMLLPWVIPSTFGILAWLWIFNYSLGTLNWVLQALHLIAAPIAWLSDPVLARGAVIFVNVWRGLPFFAITLLAGLVAIPRELYEAAEVDGATAWAQFRNVTLPLIVPILSITILFSIVMTVSDFNIVYVLTRGGPINATQVFATLAYQSAFASGNIARGAAISLFIFPALLLSLLFLLRLVRRS
jgi:multiple sugar transport system permease protein